MYIAPLRSTKMAVGLRSSEYPLPPPSVKPATVLADVPPTISQIIKTTLGFATECLTDLVDTVEFDCYHNLQYRD